jgi:hypothetical protein
MPRQFRKSQEPAMADYRTLMVFAANVSLLSNADTPCASSKGLPIEIGKHCWWYVVRLLRTFAPVCVYRSQRN